MSGELVTAGILVGHDDASDDVDQRSNRDSERSNVGVLPVVFRDGDRHEMGGAGEQQHVGNDIVVIGGYRASRGIPQRDGVRPSGEDLLVAARNDQSLAEARDTQLPSLVCLLSVQHLNISSGSLATLCRGFLG